MVRRSLLISAVLALLVMTVGTTAAAPQLINYQGILTDTNGNPINGRHDLHFKIYRDSTDTIVLWSESHTGVPITNGLVNLVLGYTTDIPLSLFGTSNRWLGIRVDSDTEMTPRTRFTSSPWSFRAAVADSALKAPGGGGAWTISGDNVYSALPGNVGIGTTAPVRKLHIDCGNIENGLRIGWGSDYPTLYADLKHTMGGGLVINSNAGGGSWADIQLQTNGTTRAYLTHNGLLGVGTSTPDAQLEVHKPADSPAANAFRISTEVGSFVHSILFNGTHINGSSVAGNNLHLNYDTNGNVSLAYGGGNVGIGTSTPTAKLEVAGTAKVQILQITGADVAEKFPVREKAEPGIVVAIDPDHAGELCIARGEYNRRVAGVISGAGNLPVGAVLGNLPGQEESLPLALSGRVWVQCDASGGPIEPGDLLTTSNTPGHAMKAADPLRSPGATIGKAMTSLREGRGLVLTLVSLQ